MTLQHPSSTIAGVLAIAMVWLFVAHARKRGHVRALLYSKIELFVEAARPGIWLPALLDGAWLLAALSMAIAAGRPQFLLSRPLRESSVVLCLDASGSMASADIWPTRARAAKAAARDFIAEAPSRVKIGIIAFAQSARVVAPLTDDRAAALAALHNVPAPNGATAIGDALALAAAQFPPEGQRAVILITDGVSNAGIDPNLVVQALAKRRVAIFAIGIGTRKGDTIAGSSQQATIDEGALRAYARSTRGIYATVHTAGELRDALWRPMQVASVEVRRTDASLIFAMAGAWGMLLAFVIASAAGTLP